MSAHSIARVVAAEQGWADSTLLGLVESYVSNQSDDTTFVDYLRTIAMSENEGIDLTSAPLRTADDLIAAQGWSGATVLDLYLTYIDRQQSPEAFEDHLRASADEENGGRCPLCGGPMEGDLDMTWCAADCTEADDADGPVCEDCGKSRAEVEVIGRENHHGDLLCDDCDESRTEDFPSDTTTKDNA